MRPLLVLWDIDLTLIDAGGAGRHLYQSAIAELYGLELPTGLASMAGRTDSAIVLEALTLAGVPEPETQVERFQAVLAARATEMAAVLRDRGRVLPGATAALAALAAQAGRVIQSLLTGNIPAFASVKLGTLGLASYLDLDIGAYGDVSSIRADLVPVARQNAAKRYGSDFDGRATVLIGDTPGDIDAAIAHGARAVGVASGEFTGRQLADAGADVVLADLTDTAAVVSAVVADWS